MCLALCLFFRGIAWCAAFIIPGHQPGFLVQLIRGEWVHWGAPWQPTPMQHPPVQARLLTCKADSWNRCISHKGVHRWAGVGGWGRGRLGTLPSCIVALYEQHNICKTELRNSFSCHPRGSAQEWGARREGGGALPPCNNPMSKQDHSCNSCIRYIRLHPEGQALGRGRGPAAQPHASLTFASKMTNKI